MENINPLEEDLTLLRIADFLELEDVLRLMMVSKIINEVLYENFNNFKELFEEYGLSINQSKLVVELIQKIKIEEDSDIEDGMINNFLSDLGKNKFEINIVSNNRYPLIYKYYIYLRYIRIEDIRIAKNWIRLGFARDKIGFGNKKNIKNKSQINNKIYEDNYQYTGYEFDIFILRDEEEEVVKYLIKVEKLLIDEIRKNLELLTSICDKKEQIEEFVNSKKQSSNSNETNNKINWEKKYHKWVDLMSKYNKNLKKKSKNTGPNEWNVGLSEACKGGHMAVIKLMIDKGANHLNKSDYIKPDIKPYIDWQNYWNWNNYCDWKNADDDSYESDDDESYVDVFLSLWSEEESEVIDETELYKLELKKEIFKLKTQRADLFEDYQKLKEVYIELNKKGLNLVKKDCDERLQKLEKY